MNDASFHDEQRVPPSPAKSTANDQNQENVPNGSTSKRLSTPRLKSFVELETTTNESKPLTSARLAQFQQQQQQQQQSFFGDLQVASSIDSENYNASTTRSDVSVSKLTGWLDDFGKQQKSHLHKTTAVGKVPEGVHLHKVVRPKNSVPAHAHAIVIERDPHANSIINNNNIHGPSKTPVRFKTLVQHKNVAATNNGYASVKELASWLADDPTTANNKSSRSGTIRRGINVIQKSRKFEKDLENVIIEQANIDRGGVSRKTKLFDKQNNQDDDNNGSDFSNASTTVSVLDKKKWLQSAFEKQNVKDKENAKDDVVKVSDKKMWLENAFASNNNNKALEKTRVIRRNVVLNKDRVPVNVDEQQQQHVDCREELPEETDKKKKSRTDEMPRIVKVPAAAVAPVPSPPPTAAVAQEEPPSPESHVDFRAARERLVSRSKENGNPVKVFTKVDRRKAKFEKWQKDLARGAGTHGLLKPSWEQSSSCSGGPSDGYEKAYVSDVAPKKSFEELP